MEIFYQLMFQYPLLSLVQTAFMIWMLVDAYRRGAEFWWYYFIFFIPLVGSLVYFFAVFIPAKGWKLPAFERKTPVAELQYRAHNSPTFANEYALGQRLIELGRHEEAIVPLEAARKREPNHAPVGYAVAQCFYEIGKPADALPFVQRILDKEPRWEDYAAWRLLLKIQEDMKLDDAVVETGRQLVKISPRMEHKYLLAEQLARVGDHGEARLILENALEEQQFVAGAIRKQNQKWVKQAKRLLGELVP